MNIKLKSYPGLGLLALKLLLAGCLAATAQGVGGFTPTGSLITARASHTATLLPNGQVLVAGGDDTFSGGSLSSAELYDPDAGVWSATGDLGIPDNARDSHTATLLPNGQVLVAGGYDYNGPLASAELYDPATGYWTSTGSLGFARYSHTATLLTNGKVLVAGGIGDNGILDSAELYDPATGFWTRTGSLGDARESDTATLLPNGQVLVAGGDDDNGDTFASAELYNPATGVWSPTGSLGFARSSHTATLLANGKVLVAGGYYGPWDSAVSASAELYDPATGAWAPTGSLAFARVGHAATLLPDGRVLVTGGDNSSTELASAELYDPATGAWSPTGSMETAREGHTATLLPNGMVLVAGGDYSGSAELYGPGISVLNPTFNNLIILGDGSFQFGFINASGPSYSVLASPDLAALPLNSWLNLGRRHRGIGWLRHIPVAEPSSARDYRAAVSTA